MAGNPPTVSNPVTVTEDAAPASITLAATPTEVPAAGGTVSFTATTNLPDGTVLHLLLANVDTGVTATTAGGAAACTFAIPPNTTLQPVTDSFTLST